MLKIFSSVENLENRFWEIDSFRGIAIIMMIISNFATDLDYFNVMRIDSLSPFWWFFSRATAVIFVFLVGVSLTLSYSRSHPRTSSPPHPLPFFKFLNRGLKIFIWGLIITLTSWFFLKNDFIIFGILHLIGLSIILAYPFLKLRFENLFLGAAILIAGFFIQHIKVNFLWLLWLGVAPQNFHYIDYEPLIPWFAVVLFGIFAGNIIYKKGLRTFKLPDFENNSAIKFLSLLGRNSLFIYLIHQPVLFLFLKILSLN